MNPRRALITGVALATSVLGLAACGTAAKKPAEHARGNGFMAYSVCVRAHGVPDFPDPAGGGGIHLPPSINPSSPSFVAADARCRHKLPGGGPPSGPPSKQVIALAVRTARCMRAHGVSGFPDPYVSSAPPVLHPDKYALVDDRDGLIIAIPKTVDVTSPAFRNASKVCSFS